jgi:arylsulfatase
VEHQRLSPRHDGGLDAEHRPHRRRGHAVHGPLRPGLLHGGARRLHHRPVPDPGWAEHRRPARHAIGLQEEDPTLAEFLKPLGYARGQFGKNHLGDLDEHLPTNHGFDEFYGILYHLNAGEYVEQYDFPKDPEVAAHFAQRGVTHSWANADGTQRIDDKGPFGTERQRRLDEEVLQESVRFIRDAVAAGEPFFVWHNTTRMHYRTNLSPEYDGKSGYGLYADGMMEMDDDVGVLLDLLDELGVADNTMVMFSTDNGAASNSWPDGGNQPFRGEKGVGGYEGGFRVLMAVRWPGVIPAGTTTGEFMTMEDWLPTSWPSSASPI